MNLSGTYLDSLAGKVDIKNKSGHFVLDKLSEVMGGDDFFFEMKTGTLRNKTVKIITPKIEGLYTGPRLISDGRQYLFCARNNSVAGTQLLFFGPGDIADSKVDITKLTFFSSNVSAKMFSRFYKGNFYIIVGSNYENNYNPFRS